MRIFFIIFMFIAGVSVYPKLASTYIYTKSDSDTSTVIPVSNPIPTSATATAPAPVVAIANTRHVYRNRGGEDGEDEGEGDEGGYTRVRASQKTKTSTIKKSTKIITKTPVKKMRTIVRATPSKSLSKYKDGEYTGTSANAYYGYVQVKAIINNGRVSDVKFLKYPNTNRNSVYLNQQAMPYLKREIIKKQNSNVDIVSGATYTSMAFRQSAKSALLKALN